MSLVTTILRKDLRQLKVLIGLLLSSLALLVVIRLELTGSVAPDPAVNSWTSPFFEQMVFMFVLIFAGKLVSYTVFEDSPGRPDRYLATRPVPAAPLALAKLAFHGLVILLPCTLASAAYLALSGMPANVVLLGSAQTLLVSLAMVALAVPLVLLWETRQRLTAGFIALGLGFAGGMLVIGLLYEFRRDLIRFRPETLTTQLNLLVMMAIAAALTTALVIVHFRRGLGLPVRIAALVLTGICAPLLGGWLTAESPAASPAAPPATHMVRSSFQHQQNGPGGTFAIALSPEQPGPAGSDISWEMASFSVGPDPLRLRQSIAPTGSSARFFSNADNSVSQGVDAALHDHLGPDWAIVSGMNHRRSSFDRAWAYVPDPLLPHHPVRLDAVFRGHAFSRQIVAELALQPGSQTRVGADTWTCNGHSTTAGRSLTISLCHRGPNLWLNPAGTEPGFRHSGYRFVLTDPERRVAILLQSPYPVRNKLAISSACPRRGLIIHLDGFDEARDFAGRSSEQLRLLILQPRHEVTSFCRWTSPAEIDIRSSVPAKGPGLARDPHDVSPEDLLAWVGENPAPPTTAPATEIARYLVSLLGITNHCGSLNRDSLLAVATPISSYVPDHLELFIRALGSLALDHHRSRSVLHEALEIGLTRSQVPDLARHLATRPRLVRVIRNRGWTTDISTDLARLIRSGNNYRGLLRAAASLPDAAGINRDEWLGVFRLSPDDSTYQILRELPGLEALLADEVDRRLAHSLPLLSATSLDPLTELGLTSGHPGAPARLHRAAAYAVRLDEHNGTWFSDTVLNHFDLSALPDHHNDPERIVPWFLAQDPAAFIFDPAERRYTAAARR